MKKIVEKELPRLHEKAINETHNLYVEAEKLNKHPHFQYVLINCEDDSITIKRKKMWHWFRTNDSIRVKPKKIELDFPLFDYRRNRK